jgi:probable HAF family extracellular repeat protein
MMSRARPMGRVSGRLRLVVAGAAVVTALTVTSAGASVSTSIGGTDARLSRLGTSASPSRPTDSSARPRTPIPGFLLDRGRVTKFDAPQASRETAPSSINNLGQIVGAYVDADVTYHGFLRDKAGRFTTIDIPGAKGTSLYRINDRGQLVGRYSQTHANIQDPNAIQRGFLLDHGRLTRIDVPGAAETQAVGINNRGQIVGEYQQPAGVFHGFLWHQGRLVTIDKPGAAATSLIDINDRGQLLGVYVGDDGVLHNFLLERGRYTIFDAPDAPDAPVTWARDLNNRGQIAGFTLAPTEEDPPGRGPRVRVGQGGQGPVHPDRCPRRATECGVRPE